MTAVEIGPVFLIFGAALLYAAVGHAGASAYLAVLALCGVSPAVMKPAALILNILVATIATVKYVRAGCFAWNIFWPFALGAVPFAFIGGMLSLPGPVYKPLVGLVLGYAAYWLLFVEPNAAVAVTRPLPRLLALVGGAGIGLLSGLTGVGGGIFLSPLLLLMGWADVRQTLGIAAAFILLNSFSGLLGYLTQPVALPGAIVGWGVAALIGGWLGADYGSRRLGGAALRRLLGVVLIISSIKMVLP